MPRAETDMDRARDLLAPHMSRTLAGLGASFTTRQFMLALQADPGGNAAYEQAVACFPGDRMMGQMTVHGILVPELLRHSGQVEWDGYVYGDPQEEDGLHVPARWVKVSA